MSGPTYPGGNPSDPGSQQGYPQYPQYPQTPQQPTYQPPYPIPAPQQPTYQPYPQPPMYQPQYAPPAQPPKRGGSNRVFLILGIVAAVLIIACVGLCALAGYGAKIFGTAVSTSISESATQLTTQFASVGSEETVGTFCEAESSQDYTTAYSQLSPTLQQQYSQTAFTQDNLQHDSTLGPVSDCTPAGLPTVSGSTATISVMVTRTLTPTADSSGNIGPTVTANATGNITLVEDSNGTWLINSVDSSLDML